MSDSNLQPENEHQLYRGFLKDSVRRHVDFSQTDQSRGIAAPPLQKPIPEDAPLIDLPKPGIWQIPDQDLAAAISNRRSRRLFSREALSVDELAFLLWATQGVRGSADGSRIYRNVPSAGCRHAFETLIIVLNVRGLDPGVYRYLPITHQLLFEFTIKNAAAAISKATLGQRFCATAAAVFVWTAVPYRMEWRYGVASYKVMAIDAGHVCQNLYLGCEAIKAGTCAIAAYDQEVLDALLHLDGEDEFAIYLAPVGKITI